MNRVLSLAAFNIKILLGERTWSSSASGPGSFSHGHYSDYNLEYTAR